MDMRMLHKDKVKDKVENLRGGLYIREYPAGQATVNTIMNIKQFLQWKFLKCQLTY